MSAVCSAARSVKADINGVERRSIQQRLIHSDTLTRIEYPAKW
jgi:hypothetical protein